MINGLIKEVFARQKSSKLIGSTYGGINKWRGGVLAPNGKIYFVPYSATQILELNPLTNTTTLIGSTYSGTLKWSGGVLAPNGKIYFTPSNATQILELDPNTNTTTLIGSTYVGALKWWGGVLAPNGKIYFAPQNSTQILELNPLTNTTALIGSTYSDLAKWEGGVLAPNGKIYFTPRNAQQILELDPNTNVTTLIGSTYSDLAKWSGGVLAPNGKIYFTPRNAQQILELDPNTNVTTLIGSTYVGSNKWEFGVLAPNGKIYFTPFSSTQILELNPSTNTTTLIGSTYLGGGKWSGGVLALNGNIYFAPFNATQILELSNSLFFPFFKLMNFAVAYSLRKIPFTVYAGAAIRVRRSSDNTEANIGFTTNGDLDTVTLLSFVGNGNGFVRTWYDQSGNSRNATQTTLVNQPQIVDSGAVLTMNGRPALRFNGTNILLTPSFMLGNTVVTVARRSTRFECVVEGSNVGSADRGLWGLRSGTTDFTTHLNYGINGSLLNATNADGFPMNVLQIVSQTVAKGAVATTPSIWGIGGGSSGYVRLNGFISEMVATSALLSTTDRQLIESNQGEYYGISFLALDQISTPAAAAYSLRKLRTAYAGNAIRVRRSSDNTEADIGFTATGELNTNTLLAFVGVGNNGFVTTWYDQSGNVRNATQTTVNLQPRIVSNGVIQTQNGRATVVQTAIDQSLLISSAFTGITSATGIFVFRQLVNTGVGSGAHGFRMNGGNTTANNHSPVNGVNALDGFFSANRIQFNNYGPSMTLTIHTARQTGTALQVFKNGVQIDTDKTVAFTTYATGKAFLIDANPNGTIALSEGFVFGTAISTTDRQLIEQNQGQYYGITTN